MILGIGVDIVEIQRIAEAVRNPRFIERVFTLEEREYCESKKSQKASSYAARFAAKEASLKALGTGLSKGRWLDVEITVTSAGKPEVLLRGFFAEIAQQMGVTEIHISLTHSRDYAVAQAIVWGGTDCENSNSR